MPPCFFLVPFSIFFTCSIYFSHFFSLSHSLVFDDSFSLSFSLIHYPFTRSISISLCYFSPSVTCSIYLSIFSFSLSVSLVLFLFQSLPHLTLEGFFWFSALLFFVSLDLFTLTTSDSIISLWVYFTHSSLVTISLSLLFALIFNYSLHPSSLFSVSLSLDVFLKAALILSFIQSLVQFISLSLISQSISLYAFFFSTFSLTRSISSPQSLVQFPSLSFSHYQSLFQWLVSYFFLRVPRSICFSLH